MIFYLFIKLLNLLIIFENTYFICSITVWLKSEQKSFLEINNCSYHNKNFI